MAMQLVSLVIFDFYLNKSGKNVVFCCSASHLNFEFCHWLLLLPVLFNAIYGIAHHSAITARAFIHFTCTEFRQ